jgi:F-type H+-transporting ATPase subunit epsilon
MSALQVAVVSVGQNIWSGEAKSLIAKTTEGEIGILAGHEPVLSLLVDGVVRVEGTNGEKVQVSISGGFLAVDNNSVRVLAEEAEVL